MIKAIQKKSGQLCYVTESYLEANPETYELPKVVKKVQKVQPKVAKKKIATKKTTKTTKED